MSAPRAFSPGSLLNDQSLYGIVLGNLVTLGAALANHWSVGPLLWIYWGQSVVIGVVNVIRMVRLKEFSTAGFTSGGRAVPENRKGKMQTAAFFAMHFGFFHFVYFIFLMSESIGGRLGPNDWLGVGVSILAFALAHGYSLWWNEGRDFRDRKPNLGTLMFYPYLRILPMHLTIIFGGAVATVALPLFIGLKTASDAGMHLVEHAIFRRGPRLEPAGEATLEPGRGASRR